MVRRDRASIRSNFSTVCNVNSGRQTYSLQILATESLNELALYCVAFSHLVVVSLDAVLTVGQLSSWVRRYVCISKFVS